VLVDQAGVLADPAEPGIPRIGTLQQRRGIDADLILMRTQLGGELFQPAAEYGVVIVTPGIPRNRTFAVE